MSAWTRGPWNVQPLTKAFGVYDQQGTQVARVGGAYGVAHERRTADAQVMAAAPELYEAAEAAWNCIGELPPTQARVEVAQMLCAALAKARGES